MKKERPELRLASPKTYEEVFRDGERVLLTLRARWPQLEETCPGCRRINRYYDALAQRWRARWTGPLLSDAKAAAGPETPPWAVVLDFTVTLFQEELFSLYWEVSENVGLRRPRRLRQGDIWQLPQGTPLTLRELLPPRRWWKGPILEEIRRQIGQRVQTGESLFFDGWPSLASRKFSPGRAYLTKEGPVVFYPIETLAPALEGFPTFSLKTLVPPDGALPFDPGEK